MVEMPLRWWNRNYVGTHFGGSLYSMVDPFYMLMLIENLGSRYVVWDKAATIRFQRPGRGRVRAEFSLEEEHILQIQRDVESHGKSNPRFVVQVKNDEGETVAEIEKTLSIKLRS
jgi:acyl-coenzyme A thioesterase PaaI-like protein